MDLIIHTFYIDTKNTEQTLKMCEQLGCIILQTDYMLCLKTQFEYAQFKRIGCAATPHKLTLLGLTVQAVDPLDPEQVVHQVTDYKLTITKQWYTHIADWFRQ